MLFDVRDDDFEKPRFLNYLEKEYDDMILR